MLYGKLKKKRCWGCGSLDSIKWGKQQNKQRFKCKNCGLLFTSRNDGVKNSNRFIWFEEWVAGRQTFIQISKQSGYSERTLKRIFYDYLQRPPVLKFNSNYRVNLLIDGTYFSNNLCLIVYRDNTVKYTQLYRITDGEWYEEIREDLANIQSMGVVIESVTSDGHRAILKAVRKQCKETILQRCLVHIQRISRIWLSSRPKSEAGISLRHIVSKLHTIENREQWGYWIVSLIQWHNQHYAFLNEKSFNPYTQRLWYKHKFIRRSFTTIKRALPDMFHYLDNPRIPKSTNGLESFFGHLKSHLTVHRGLSKEHRKNFIKWYLFFRNRK